MLTEYEYTDSWYDVDDSDPNTLGNIAEGALLKKITEAKGTTSERVWTTGYGTQLREPVRAANGWPHTGHKVDVISETSPLISIPGGGTQTIVETTVFDTEGKVTKVYDTEDTSVYTAFEYASGQAYGNDRLIRIKSGVNSVGGSTDTKIEQDDWGRVLRITANEGVTTPTIESTTTYIRGADNRIIRQETPKGGTKDLSRIYYDVWGNPAVVLRWNRKHDDTQHHAHGQAVGSPRDWVRSEWQRVGDRLYCEYRDRRPLHMNDNGTDALGGPDPWMLKWEYEYFGDVLSSIEYPNGVPNGAPAADGTKKTFFVDGYGALYKTEFSHPTQTTKVGGKNFFNNDLEIVRVIEPGEGEYQYERNYAGYIDAVVNPTGVQPTQYGTGAPFVFYVGATGGARNEYVFDIFGNLVSESIRDPNTLPADPNLSKIDYERDEVGRAVMVKEIILGIASPPVVSSDTEYTYNKRSQVIKVTDTSGDFEYSYNNKGQLIREEDLQNVGQNKKEYYYNLKTDRIEKVEIFAELEVHTGSNSVNKYVSSPIYGMGGIAIGSQDSGLDGLAIPRSWYSYFNSLGNIECNIDAAQKNIWNYYDGLGREVQRALVGLPSDIVLNRTYTDQGFQDGESQIDRVDGNGFLVRSIYDHIDRLTIEQRPGANYLDKPTASSPYKPNSLFYEYDDADRVKFIYEGRGARIDHHYDSSGNLLVREMQNNPIQVSKLTRQEIFNRNLLGQITSNGTIRLNGAIPTIVSLEINDWDSLGRLHKEKYFFEGDVNGDEPVIDHLYTGSNPYFRDGLRYSDGTILSFAGDSIGRLSQIDAQLPGQSVSSTLATYKHRAGMVNERELHYGAATGKTAYIWDSYGRMGQIKDTVASTVMSQFDLEYDLADNLVKEFHLRQGTGYIGGGDRFVYNDFHQLKEQWLGLDATSMGNTLVDTTSVYLERKKYTLDKAINRESVDIGSNPTGSSFSSYIRDYQTEDGISNISNRYWWTNPGLQTSGLEGYQYDAAGNLFYDGVCYYVYDYLNRLTEVWKCVETTSQASSGGGVEALQQSVEGGHSHAVTPEQFAIARNRVMEGLNWDYGRIIKKAEQLRKAGRLSTTLVINDSGPISSGSSIEESGGGAQSSISCTFELWHAYGYDVSNRRILRLVYGQQVEYYTYDGWEELETIIVKDNQMVASKTFVWGDGLGELVTYVNSNHYAQGGVTHTPCFAHQKYHESVVLLVDDQGNEVERIEYDPFGKSSVYVAGVYQGQYSTVGNPFLWNGKRVDHETGAIYNWNRYYNPLTGKFFSPDPMGYSYDSGNLWNGYGYGRSSPTSAVDIIGFNTVDDGPNGTYESTMPTAFPSGNINDYKIKHKDGSVSDPDHFAEIQDHLDYAVFGRDNILYYRFGFGWGSLTGAHELELYNQTLLWEGFFQMSGGAFLGFIGAASLLGLGKPSGGNKAPPAKAPPAKAPPAKVPPAKVPPAKEGIYDFPDQQAPGQTYVGQSGNMPGRLSKHAQSGRLLPGTEKTTAVPGGKVAREIAEHKRIQQITGGVPARLSPNVSNKRDPIGRSRTHLLDIL